MELNAATYVLARELLNRVQEESLSRLDTAKGNEVRAYYAKRGPLLRQLAYRVLTVKQTGRDKEGGINWSIADLRSEVLTRAVSDATRSEYERWFAARQSLLRGLASRFWMLAQIVPESLPQTATPTTQGKLPAVRRREMGISDQLLAAYLLTHSEARDPKERTEHNLQAISLLAGGTPIDGPAREKLARYSGFGGLSIDRIAERLPAQWQPEADGLIHEYYTPPLLCRELARVLRPYIARIPTEDGIVQALEPSAGIGRFLHALSLSGFENVNWTAVEYSALSSAMLRAMRPDIRVVHSSFEKFVSAEEQSLMGRLGLVVSNPPYGPRGPSAMEDTHPEYQRERRSQVYFLRRGLDLLRRDGIGVFVLPYGLLTGLSAEYIEVRRTVLRRHHLMVAFRLPSNLFPGTSVVTDLLLFRARGGELAEVVAEDQSIVEGRYFQEYPSHLLGTELRTGEQEASDGEE